MTQSASIYSPKGLLVGAVLAGVLLLLGVVLGFTLSPEVGRVLTWASLGVGLVYGLKAAWDALASKTFDIDVLMVMGAIAAAAIGHPGEGALLLFLFTLSGALEEYAAGRTQREVQSLHKLMPVDALALRDGQFVPVPAEQLVEGDIIKVRPGERVPADATLTSGATSMDQAAITGESMPRDVNVGDELFAGTVNVDDVVEARVLRRAKESSLQRIMDLVTTAQEQRAPVQRTLDAIDQPYSIGVLVASIVVFFVWWLVLGRAPLATGENAKDSALYVAITLLIVASPCALMIATPTATLAGLARAARGGVLVKGGQALSRLAGIRAMCLDKTGTLTHGRPVLYEVHPVALSEASELLAVAAALEEDSTHPIAQAILSAARARNITPAHVSDINHTTAEGLSGHVVRNGSLARVRLGRLRFVEPLVPVCYRARTREVLSKIQQRGHIGVVIAIEEPGQVEASDDTQPNAQPAPLSGQVGVLIMADTLRPGASSLVPELHALGISPIRMLTGDNDATAQRVAKALRLDAVDSELLPADKLRIVHEVRKTLPSRSGVALIGDGINDAPALAAADAALAMGSIGTAAALENADAVLLGEELTGVPWVIRLARAVRRTVTINIAIALTAMVVMAVATLVFSALQRPIPLSVGVVTHEGGTLLVVLNSLLLLKFRK
jgi:Cd2+/Zn2+-exporting ATPase